MNSLKNTATAALTILLVSGAAVTPAGAITLLDIIRGGPANSRPSQERATSLPGVPGAGVAAQTRTDRDPEPLPRIAGPRYYTYKADAARLIATAGFPAAEAQDASRFLADARVSAEANVAKAVEAYYGAGGRIIWVTDGELNDRARSAIAALEDAASVGLDPADYLVPVPSEVTASISASAPVAAPELSDTARDAHDRAMMQFELALSAKVLTYVQDTVRGRIDPNRISGYHDFKRRSVNLAPVLKLVSMSPDVGAYLASRQSASSHFQALKAELAKLRAEDAGDGQRIELSANLLLKPGNRSADMASVVKLIERKASDALKVDHSVTLATYADAPEYTPELVELVKAFQKESGLKPDGIIGRATVRAMIGHSNDEKIDRLIVAMEQARWLPNDLGSRFVFINQPAFTASYHEEGAEQFSMRVVIGSKANQTYFFQDEIETVEFNPYWGVPQSIIVNEMLPKLRADPSYLDRLGYQVAVRGKPVSSSSVDWYGSTNAISVRQPPSSDNALGELKILFPNEHAIYMHDTPSKSYFQRDNRALSHGCIRLSDPRRMAAAVMGTTVDEIGRHIDTGRNRAVQVPQKIPVYVAYFTAWPNKDGVVEYFDDVYERDAAMVKAFAITTKARGAQS